MNTKLIKEISTSPLWVAVEWGVSDAIAWKNTATGDRVSLDELIEEQE